MPLRLFYKTDKGQAMCQPEQGGRTLAGVKEKALKKIVIERGRSFVGIYTMKGASAHFDTFHVTRA